MNNNTLSENELSFLNSIAVPKETSSQDGSIKTSYLSPEESSFVESIPIMNPNEDKMSKLKSVGSVALKGLTQGVIQLGEMFGGLQQGPGVREQQEKKREETLNKALPSEEGAIEGFVERGSKMVPGALAAVATGGATLPTMLGLTAASAFAGEAAKQFGFGETGQAIAEAAPLFGPSLAKKLVGSTKQQQQLIDFARKAALTEAQIAPAIAEENYFRKWLSKLTYKGESTQKKIQESKKALGTIYETIKNSPQAKVALDPKLHVQTGKELAEEIRKLPQSLQKVAMGELKTLGNSKKTAEDFIQFFQNIHYEAKQIGKAAVDKVQGLQKTTKNIIGRMSPEIGEDFELINKLYNNVSKLGGGLKMPAHPDFLLYTKGAGMIYGLWTGNYELAAASAGTLAARKMATKLLLDPRLQNLSTKTIQAINNNKIPAAQKFFNEFREGMKETSPEFYNDTADIDLSEFVPEQ